MNKLDLLKQQLIASGVAPQVALGCARRTPEGWKGATGGDVERIFDLASLTKPMTAMACARLPLPKSMRLRDVWPEVEGTYAAGRTLEDLLSHRAGLAANLSLFLDPDLERRTLIDHLRRAADERRDEKRSPDGAVYSDLSYILAGAMLARAGNFTDPGEAIERLVIAPLERAHALGTARSLASIHADFIARVAPTEDVAWRGGVIRGAVHDENAWALTGTGASGHAGIFGTVEATLTFAMAAHDAIVCGEGPLAVPGAVRSALSWMIAPRPGGTERAGFDGKSASGSSAGERLGPHSFGHLGFTGTSFWIDPEAPNGAIAVVLLTNRVHPSRENGALRAARPRVHTELAELALQI